VSVLIGLDVHELLNDKGRVGEASVRDIRGLELGKGLLVEGSFCLLEDVGELCVNE
jgi:hypothetical protein